jgi:hypothetical protein
VSPNSITSAGGMDPPGRDGSSHWRFLPTGARRCEGSLGHLASVSVPAAAAGQTPDAEVNVVPTDRQPEGARRGGLTTLDPGGWDNRRLTRSG